MFQVIIIHLYFITSIYTVEQALFLIKSDMANILCEVGAKEKTYMAAVNYPYGMPSMRDVLPSPYPLMGK